MHQPGRDDLRLVWGDNLAALTTLRHELEGKVTLAYLDPPFLTKRTHHRISRKKTDSGRMMRTEKPAFDDHWDGMAPYLEALEPRLKTIRDCLAPDGSLVVHIDSKTSHYVKVLCDEIFGPDCFASEIIWRYRRWPAKTPNFQRMHDVLLRYVKDTSVKPRFNQLYEPLAASTLATWGKGKQKAVVGQDGRRVRSSTTSETSPGVPMSDVWEIGIVAPVAKERTGYPTQKPRALLERIIEALSSPGDLVLDPYAGSGTTLDVAQAKNRRVIGIDSSAESIAVISERLATDGLRIDRLEPVGSAKALRSSDTTAKAQLTG